MSNLVSKIKADLGTVKFLKSAWEDAHIKESVALLAKEQKSTEAKVQADIQTKIDAFKDVAKYSSLLYDTIALNIIESEIFNKLTALTNKAEEHEKFDPVLFMALIRTIKTEHTRFFPLRNFVDSKHVYNPRWILVPNDNESESLNSISTAAATSDGKFIFNVNFMQKLLDFARIKGLKPKSKKYANNGGRFPEGYAYIEFLIIHELLHYTQADFHYGKIFKEVSPKIMNWVGDFRSNYELVKGGYEQLPIGLYSDHINYDRQNTYKEMIDIVTAEMDKLPKSMQDKVQQQLDNMTDEHTDGEPGDPGEPEPSEDANSDKIDKAAKATRESMDNKKDSDGESDSPAKPSETNNSGKAGKGNTSSADTKFNADNIVPKYSWTQLLTKAIRSSEETEETYMKPNRRGITGAVLARSHGSAAVKPGDIINSANIKLLIVVDSSGSMTSGLATVYANIKKLLVAKEVSSQFLLMRFSDIYDEWACNIKTNVAIGANKEKGSVSNLFTTTYGGGTQLTGEMVNHIHSRMAKGFNTVFFSDADALDKDNIAHLRSLIASKAFIIFDSKHTFTRAVDILKTVPFGMSHL